MVPPVSTEPLPAGLITTGEHQALVADPSPPRRVWPGRVVRALGLLLILSAVYMTVTFLQVWRASSQDSTPPSDAIVVLGAAQYDGLPSPILESRLDHALELYQRGVAPTIVVTGGRQAGDTFTEATTGYNWLREKGVPDEAIRKEVQGTSTFESLSATARFLREDGADEVVLVTDDYHALRVAGIAGEVGLDPHLSTVSQDGSSASRLARETMAVSIGRITGYRRLTNLTG
ncbi:MAG: YdcF family protein [Iamia sp.]